MNNKSNHYKYKTYLFLSLFFLVVGVFLFEFKDYHGNEIVNAGAGDSMSGFAWSDNIGWLSFNCTDVGVCGTKDYGVNIDSLGNVSGNAWSDNIGWVSFNRYPVISSISAGTGGRGISIQGNYAYIVYPADKKMVVFDITNPTSPKVVGQAVDGVGSVSLSYPVAIVVSGNYAYVCNSSGASMGVEIIDISTPSSPTHKGKLVHVSGVTHLNSPQEMAIQGNYLYLSVPASNSMTVVNVTNPASPTEAGYILNGGLVKLQGPTGIAVSGNYAYVTSEWTDSLEIINISVPSTPTHVSSIVHGAGGAVMDDPQDVYVSGNYAYIVSLLSKSLEIINISVPSAPVHVGSLVDLSGGANLYSPYWVVVRGNYAFISNNTVRHGIEVVDVTNKNSPSHYALITTPTLTSPEQLVAVGDYIYEIGWDSYFHIIPDNGTLCPSSPCLPKVNMATGDMTGWARAISGSGTEGWDGWISLSGISGDGSPYGVKFTGKNASGYAWGDNVVGWLSFGKEGGFGGVVNATNITTVWTINASSGANGSIAPNGAVSVLNGGDQSFTMTPNSGYMISSITVDGASVPVSNSSGQTYTFNNVIADHTISVAFSLSLHTINATVSGVDGAGGGSITPSGAISVSDGTNQTFNMSPASGHYISSVRIDTVDVGAVNTYTFNNVTTDHTIDVYFTPDTVNGSCGPAASRTVIEPLSGYCNFGNRANYKYDSPTATWGWRCVGIGLGATNADCSTINSCKTNLLCEPQYGETPFNCPSNCKVKLEER